MWRMLTNIAKTHQRKLLVTLGLVGAENLLLMIYPVFGGWVINAVIDGNIFQSLMYGLVVLLMWMIGALRRAVDTRTFTKIYTQIAVPVVLEQREKQILHSAITARVALSREFVTNCSNVYCFYFGCVCNVTCFRVLGRCIGFNYFGIV